MRTRQAKKIIKQDSPAETDQKSRSWWNRYNRYYTYSQRCYNKVFNRWRREGKLPVWSDTEIDKMIDEIIKEESNSHFDKRN